GKIKVFPALRPFRKRPWAGVATEPLRDQPEYPMAAGRIEQLLAPYRQELARWPLYVSLDKDVLVERDSVVNWDSGHLTLNEVSGILESFVGAARGNLAGIDVVGDWSPVRLTGLLRRWLHFSEHPALEVNAIDAVRRNERTNLALLQTLESATGAGVRGGAR